jgi:hypothetical protein
MGTMTMRWHPNWVSVGVSALALAVSACVAYTSYNSLVLNRETQQAALFAQFQQEYTAVAARFPPQIYDPDFRPVRGSDEYKRLEDYWVFCYAEWYATNKTRSAAYHELWNSYYSDLVLNALNTPSLRYVLIDMFHNYGVKRTTLQEFYEALRNLARSEGETLDIDNTSATH